MSRDQRGLFQEEESSAESGHYGCPMLMRGRGTSSMNGHKPFWRCSLGWAVRTDEDVACCQATDSVASCWVAHPELKASLEEGQTAENVEPRAAD